MQVSEVRKLDAYLKKLFGNANIRVVPKSGEFAEVFVGEDDLARQRLRRGTQGRTDGNALQAAVDVPEGVRMTPCGHEKHRQGCPENQLLGHVPPFWPGGYRTG